MSRIGQRLEKTPEATFLREFRREEHESSFISSLLVQAPPAARLMPLPFAPLPHAFPAASASTPSAGRRALGPETRLRLLPVRRWNSWELKRSSI